jgi:hypothetical protein
MLGGKNFFFRVCLPTVLSKVLDVDFSDTDFFSVFQGWIRFFSLDFWIILWFSKA